MAVVKWTALITSMKGKLRGSVLQMGAGGQIIRSNRQFNQPSNPRWNASKQNTANTVYAWRVIDSATRAAWAAATVNYPTLDRYGGTHYPSPYTLWMRLQNPLSYHLNTFISVPATPWAFSNLGAVSASVDASIPQIIIYWTMAYASFEWMLINGTAPLSAGRRPPKGLYSKINLYNNLSGFSQDITADYLARYGQITANSVYFFEVKLLAQLTGQLSPPYITSAYS
jgi:hypothetical protein